MTLEPIIFRLTKQSTKMLGQNEAKIIIALITKDAMTPYKSNVDCCYKIKNDDQYNIIFKTTS